MKPQAYSILGMVADSLLKNPMDTLIVKGFEGKEEAIYRSYRISYKRAKSVKDAFINDLGIKEERIKIEYAYSECRCAKLYVIKPKS